MREIETPVLDAVLFKVGSHCCGLPLSDVREVIRVVAVTPVPHMPAFMEGAINLRGLVIPVMDLRKRFGMSPGPHDSRTRIMVVPLQEKAAGLIVDEVLTVTPIVEESSGLAPGEGFGFDHLCVSRVVKSKNRLALLLDLAKTLSPVETQAPHGGDDVSRAGR